MFGKLFGKKPPAPTTPTLATPEPKTFSLPEGQAFWEIRPNPTFGGKSKGFGEFVTLGPDWNTFGQTRLAAAAEAAPKLAHLHKAWGIPAYDYRFRTDQYPSQLTLKGKTAKGLPEYGVIGSVPAAWVASARVAAIIERFEPGRFNFLPFAVAPESGSPQFDYCFWQPEEFIHTDTVLYDRSGYRQALAPNGNSYWQQPFRLVQPPVILDAGKVQGRHWITTGTLGMPSHRLLSDALKQALGDFLPTYLTLVEARAVQR
jgi:hypothetical protein